MEYFTPATGCAFTRSWDLCPGHRGTEKFPDL